MFARRGADGDVCATAKRPSTDASAAPSKKGGLHAVLRAAVFRSYAMPPPHGRAENAPLLLVGSSILPPILTAFDPFHACVSPSMWVCLSQTARSVFGCPRRIRGKERSELCYSSFYMGIPTAVDIYAHFQDGNDARFDRLSGRVDLGTLAISSSSVTENAARSNPQKQSRLGLAMKHS